MTATEVATAHAAAESREKRAADRLARLPLVARIYRPRSVDALRLGDEPEWTPIATVVVAAIDGPDELIGPRWMSQDAFQETFERNRGHGTERPIRKVFRWTITAHGLVEEEIDPKDSRRLLHRLSIFRAGVVEWAHRYRGDFEIPSRSFANDVHNALLYAAKVFDEVGYAGRLATWVRIENAERAQLLLARDLDADVRLPDVEWIGGYREVAADELIADPTATVREAMDRIWQGCGLNRCLLFDENGDWLHSE